MARYINATLIAFVITAALFLGMRFLIVGGENVFSEPAKGRVLDFVRLKKEESVQKKQRKPKKPPKPEEPPPDIQQPPMQAENMAATNSGLAFSAKLDVDSGLEGGLALDSGDGEYLPIVKVAPIYPRRALSRGIEGYVIVEFTVTRLGTVRNPKVVEAKPEGIFNQAAMEAAKKFKYKPRVIDGTAAEVAGVQNKITFKMNR
ncbi:energy transducer TonB [Aliikangiella coralliicola]|uniref:Protein TonB n=1 Tax=Aliikangiella coralliicola TaxID=2592383 RepID=A0A545UFX0_9GAMM|nr:energy transducer TonB [Aliikangiella coralliicola]TQV88376.1 energy transducer TonB [Aliikangiella coralliicola]